VMERSVYGRHRVFLPKQKNIIKKGGKAKNILRSVEMNKICPSFLLTFSLTVETEILI
jgi:hypothetical protein